ncbi:hypothetical protein GCM10009133_11590 [Cocleimonas flava]|uniref:Uncharacterized protein n=1 Tax=Cocleimonas flava TaxID=634765 RepID=A0A4R1F4G3_9GAMM|nr:hypothetical protein [Cocleimonas flava]TCJ87522.1 hypothetical protein EV695_2032 [Cocleimonas flava]
MKAIFISTEGEYLQAKIEVNGQPYYVMDEFSSENSKNGEIVNLDIFSGLEDESEEWESIFNGNPDELKKLQHQSGWKYRAYGKIISIKPVIVDIGLFETEAPFQIQSNDIKVIGSYIAFTIQRLGASIV